MIAKLKALASAICREFGVYRLVLKDSRTPKLPKILLSIALGYALLPFDIIPDWIPVLGYLDDLIVVPGLVILALKLVPEEIVSECRRMVEAPEQST